MRNGFFWTGISDLTADKVLGNELNPYKKGSAVDEVAEWLQDTLSDGPMEKRDIEQLAEEAGFSKATLRRARENIKVLTYKKPGAKISSWLWELPESYKGKSLSKLTSCNFPSNGAGFTTCSSKNGEQVVEALSDKDLRQLDNLFNDSFKEDDQHDQVEQKEMWEVNVDDLPTS